MELTFSFKFMLFHCECGEQAREVRVASCSDYFLLFEWECDGCQKQTRARLSFEQLSRGVPEHPTSENLAKRTAEFLKKLRCPTERIM